MNEKNDNRMIWSVSPMDQLRRFLVLGVTGGTFSTSEQELTRKNCESIVSLIAKDGRAVVDEIVRFSEDGRAPKKDPQLFALALCATATDADTRGAAYAALPKVCNIPTHLFGFVGYCEQLSEGGTGWGRGRRKAVAEWYNNKSTKDLIYHITKYKQRDGWSNRDMLRLAHVKPVDNEHGLVYKFVTKGELAYNASEVTDKEAFDRLGACDEIQRATSVEQVVKLIQDFNLVHEHIPTEWHKNPQVWEALLPKMPLNALLRNVGRLTSLGLLDANSANTTKVLEKFGNKEAVSKSRIHPFNVMVALNQYKNGGEGGLGKLRWTPNSKILGGLDELFHDSFSAVEPSGKRYSVNLDVSGSMGSAITGTPSVTCAMGAAALAMTFVRTEPSCITRAFCHQYIDLGITANMSLSQVMTKAHNSNFGSTDCALPMTEALRTKTPIDMFVVITDSETNSRRNPAEALREYREKMGIDARLVVLAMTSSNRTIASPDDKGMLDLVGFDSAGPQIIREFALGKF